ncbi:LYR motif-containing protein 5 [Borealophlyctis nickersoniae]|nr:LYR motif-containing protein 5 [Borealophlyctis nickersoniae]
MTVPPELHSAARNLYKQVGLPFVVIPHKFSLTELNRIQLLYIGREYPAGYDYFRSRLKNAFAKKRNLEDPEKIKQAIKHGEFVYKELEALWFLKKYRTMKEKYSDPSH